MRYATWSVQHDREMRKKLRLSQRILSAIMTPVMVFSMTGMNFSVAGLMTAHAEDAIVATDTVTTPASTPVPATVESPKVDTPKVDPTPAPVIPKVETPAPASVVDPAPKAADPMVAPVTDPTPISAPAVDSTPSPDSTPAIVPAATVPTTPTVDAAGEATTERVIPEWVADGNKQTTGSSVVLGKKYVAPQNDQVTVTFTKLPENAGKLSIEEITLSDEQVASLHALSNKAYDITSDMADGTFAYTMTLPKPKDQKNVQIKFAEDVAGLESASTVPSGDVKTKTDSVSAKLDHFTIYTVTSFDHTLTYTFDEAVHLVTEDGSATIAKAEIAGKLSVYKYDSYAAYSGGAEPYKATDVSITGATFETGTEAGKVLSITYTGTLENNVKYVVDAWGYRIVNEAGVKVAAGSSDNQIILGDTVPPTTIADTVYDGSAKTITYTFSEPVRFKSEDTGAISAVDASKLAIYLYDAGSGNYGPDKVTGTNITNASFAGNVLTLTFTGNLVNQTDTSYIVDAFGYDIVDLAGNKLTRDSNQIFNVVADTIAPTESSVVLDQTAKKVTTTFSEVVHLVNDDYSAHPTLTKDDLGIYTYTAGSWHNVDVVSISAVTLVDKVLTVTYTGTLPIGTYIIDTYGTKVVDASGNEMVDAGALTFDATGVIDTPSIAGVTAPVTDATPTSTITATDLYTATISWSGDPATFHPGTEYTATITITPKSGYTLTGVTSDYFTVAGATATNSANSGVISAVFPTTATKQLTIADPSSLTLSKTYDGTTTAAVTAGALSGVVSGDAVTVSAVATYNTKDFGTGKTITVVYTLGGADSAKYIKPANYVVTNGEIIKATATVTVTPYTASYDGNAHSATVASINGVNGETGATVGTVSLTTTHTNAGTYGTDSWSFAGAANYNNIAPTTITDTINKADLTITADDISKAYGATDPTLTASYDGFVNSETESVLDTPVTLTRDAGEAVGSYTITAHGAADANYNIAYVDGTFSIGQTTPDGDGNATLDNSNPQVVITDGSQAVTLEITNGTTDPSIDVSGLLGGGVSGTLPEITINTDVADVVIPDGTTVTGPAGWDGIISAPTSGTPSGGNAPAGFAVGDTVITLGSPDGTITFDTPVVITLPGVTGAVGYRPAGSTQWHEITNVCTGTYESPTGAPAGGECAISNGTDTKILTYHFTSFGNLLDTQAPDAVKSLKATYGPKTDGKVEVTWHAKDSDISKTLVYRGETKHFTMNWDSRVAKQNKSDESYIDKNVEPGKTYYYKVVTEDAAGNQSDAEVIKIVIPEGDVAATGVLQGTEPAPNDKADKSGTVGTGTASDVSGTVSGATTGDQTVTDKGAAVLGADTQAGGFWGSVWMWIIVIGLGAGAVTIFMRRRPKGIA